jgi:hypothetical protein
VNQNTEMVSIPRTVGRLHLCCHIRSVPERSSIYRPEIDRQDHFFLYGPRFRLARRTNQSPGPGCDDYDAFLQGPAGMRP